MPYKDPEKQREAKRRWEEKNRKGTQHKTWMIIFYDESAPYWRDELSEVGLECVVSPLHDKDVWTQTDEAKNPEHKAGTYKKPHYHLLVEYPHAVTYAQVANDFSFLNTKNIKYAKSKRAMALYLCHLKDKGKAQYSSDGIVEFGGANWRDWCNEIEDLHSMMREMRAFCRDNNVFDFYLFWDWCDANNDEWSRALDVHCAYAMERYLKSLRAAAKAGELVEPGVGISTTPTPGGPEPRTRNPRNIEAGEYGDN